MALRPILPDLEGIPDAIPRSEIYMLDETSGQYRVMLTEDWELKTDVEPLRAAVDRERQLRQDAERQAAERKIALESFGEYTPDQIKTMRDELDSIADKKVLDDDGVEALLELKLKSFQETRDQREREIEAARKAAEEERDRERQQRRELLFQQQVAGAASAVDAFWPHALPDAASRAIQDGFTVNDRDQVVQLDHNGEVINGRNGVQPKTLKEWLEDAAKDETTAHWFQSAHGGGLRNRGNGAPMIPVDTTGMSGRDMVRMSRRQQQQALGGAPTG